MQTEGMIIWGEKGYVAFNPDEKPIEELLFIYGYNTGEILDERYMLGKLMAEDGTALSAHYSPTETFQRQDLQSCPAAGRSATTISRGTIGAGIGWSTSRPKSGPVMSGCQRRSGAACNIAIWKILAEHGAKPTIAAWLPRAILTN